MTVCLTYIYTCELDPKYFANSHRPFHQFWVCPSLLADTTGWQGLQIHGGLLVSVPVCTSWWQMWAHCQSWTIFMHEL